MLSFQVPLFIKRATEDMTRLCTMTLIMSPDPHLSAQGKELLFISFIFNSLDIFLNDGCWMRVTCFTSILLSSINNTATFKFWMQIRSHLPLMQGQQQIYEELEIWFQEQNVISAQERRELWVYYAKTQTAAHWCFAPYWFDYFMQECVSLLLHIITPERKSEQ